MRDILGIVFGLGSGLLVGFLIGLAVFGLFGFVQGGGTNIPYDTNHSDIANSVQVQDKTFNAILPIHHLQTGPIEIGANSPLTVFPDHLQTTQSIWSFTSGGDVDVMMLIVGPGTDGHTYSVSFMRAMWNEAVISCGDQTVHWLYGQDVTFSNIEVQR